ncbi:hypothetical protein BDW22DRAFT_1071096 [Trametopsis cervina]|nr:hypothetical protein BDW22DRAFT_1071096 [Trametopsis cervina]
MATWLYNSWTQLLQWFNSSWMGGHNEESTPEASKAMSSEEAVTSSVASQAGRTLQPPPSFQTQQTSVRARQPTKPGKRDAGLSIDDELEGLAWTSDGDDDDADRAYQAGLAPRGIPTAQMAGPRGTAKPPPSSSKKPADPKRNAITQSTK